MTLIVKGVGRNKVRTSLIVVSIAIAFLLYGTLFGFNHSLDHGGQENAANELLVHNAASLMVGLPVSHGPEIARTEGVEVVTSATLLGSYFQEPSKPVPLLMVEAPTHLRIFGPDMELVEGDMQAFLARRDAVLVSEEVARQHGWSAGQDLPLFSGLYLFSDFGQVWPFHVAAIFRTREGAAAMPFALGHRDYLEASPNWRGQVHWYTLRTRDAARNDEVAARIDARFANSEAATKTQSANMMARAFLAQIGSVSLLITIIVGSAFVTILLIAGNTMALAVRRRTGEIGIMRVLGFSRARIFQWILGEALLIALLGGGAGLLVASALLPVLTGGMNGADAAVGLPIPVLMTGLGLILLVGLLTGILPALRAMRLVPVDALRRPS